VAVNTTPAFLKTFFQHFADKPPTNDPRHELAYHEAIVLVKKFLEYGAKHTVEQVQSFTANKIPTPGWVSKQEVVMEQSFLDEAAQHLIERLGEQGLAVFGGSKWWQYRIEALTCEWIEMKKDQQRRLADPTKPQRVILYIHGGAYYFGSVDEHRYQIQRHARKLGGRAFAANYRLAPQYPAPCGIHDNLACYLYLLKQFKPEEIILSGDSAGGGMCLSLLTVIRDQGLPLPAGCVLISPWVDLNHSFPSIMADSSGDYIPPSGFQHKPSIAWPPPTTEDIAAARNMTLSDLQNENNDSAATSDNEEEDAEGDNHEEITGNDGSLLIDGKFVKIVDQVQLYATNEQLTHPLVSPVIAGSLGGLCPLFVMCGGSELLRDEIIYVAHKAANPASYPPMDLYLDADPRQREMLNKYGPTQVHLQVYDDCCHVTPTIAMCRPAKYMYRAIANFSLWALARFEGPQQTDIADLLTRMHLVEQNLTESGADLDDASDEEETAVRKGSTRPKVTVTGVEPVYVDHMIRERVSIHGEIRQMEPVKDLSMLHLDPNDIGVIKPGPVKKFMAARGMHDRRYGKRKAKLQRQRAREYARAEREGFAIGNFEGDVPPPAALAGRASLKDAETLHKTSKGGKTGVINTLFSLVSGSRDKDKVSAEAKVDSQAS
ncbi:Alpha/Beta hydrolase protein, partial [Protomyces lactucae-debilis]